MPDSRDRLVRTMDPACGSARRPLGLGSNLFERPRLLENPVNTGTAAIRIPGEDSVRMTRSVYTGQGGRNFQCIMMRMASATASGTPASTRGRSGWGRGFNSLLPSWYPRTPLRDITIVARAYDHGRRRLSRLRDGRKDSDLITWGSSSPASSSAGAPHKHDGASVFMTPSSSGVAYSRKQSVCDILLDVVETKSGDDSEFLTPQRKILNEIDAVQDVVLEGIRQFHKTPSAKKAERERKVRVLMSMR